MKISSEFFQQPHSRLINLEFDIIMQEILWKVSLYF